MQKKFSVLFCLSALFLGGCASHISLIVKETNSTLPPTKISFTAPTGDLDQEYLDTVLLYLPDPTRTRLISQSEEMIISAARHPGDAVIRRLLGFLGSASVLPLSENVDLQLAPGSSVEISDTVATVNLAASALQLEHRDLFMVGQAITNTLSQWNDIKYVNILISGIQPGLDVAATLPMGSLQMNLIDNIDTIWERVTTQKTTSTQRFSSTVTLYFPATAGKGILAEARTVSFSGQTPEHMILAVLDSLSAGAQYLTKVPTLPDLSALLSRAPAVENIAVTGGRKAVLYFDVSFNELLASAEVPRSIMMASLTYTLSTFIPGISGIEVYIGDEAVSMVVPAGIYTGAGEAILFEKGLMRRSDFSAFLLSYCILYFTNNAKTLAATKRPIPYFQSQNVRYILSELMRGPQPYDNLTGLSAAIPISLKDADLLGVSLIGDSVLLNFSPVLQSASQGMSANEERLMVYSIVNTMTALPIIKRVYFYIAGTQPDTFAGKLYLPGEFMMDPGIVR